jgi:hypothetical protein
LTQFYATKISREFTFPSKGPHMPLVFNPDPTATEIVAQVTEDLGSGKDIRVQHPIYIICIA